MSHCMHVHYLCDVHVCVLGVCVCACACVCVCVHMCVCLHGGCVQAMCVCVCAHVCVFAWWMCTGYVCVCVCVHMCVCLHGGCVQAMCVGHVWCTLVVHAYISLLRVHTPDMCTYNN